MRGRRSPTSAGRSGSAKLRFYVWKKKYVGLGTGELRRLRQLEDENSRLKRVVADLTRDNRPWLEQRPTARLVLVHAFIEPIAIAPNRLKLARWIGERMELESSGRF